MNKNQLQQGDVLLERVNNRIADAKVLPLDKRGIVLMEGEVSGHYHGLSVGDELSAKIQLLEDARGVRYMRNGTDETVTIRHAEHRPIDVPPGLWKIGRVREKDWFQDMTRPVMD